MIDSSKASILFLAILLSTQGLAPAQNPATGPSAHGEAENMTSDAAAALETYA